jgi:hypothetical protein
MKIADILKKVGAGVIKNTVPGGALIVDIVNDLLPDKYKLPEDVTGSDLEKTIKGLPPEAQAAIFEKELNIQQIEIQESHSTLRVALDSDAKNPHSTRPYIAKHSFHVIGVAILITVSAWAYGVVIGNAEIVRSVMDGWPFILAAVGPLVYLLHAYFGILKTEHKNKLDAANGKQAQSEGIAGIISAIVRSRDKS